jgi:hypothetical protein
MKVSFRDYFIINIFGDQIGILMQWHSKIAGVCKGPDCLFERLL